jgi:hypothetical protein
VATALLLGCRNGDAAPAPAQPAPDGVVVWESNRTGDWRIFAARLDGSGARQLSPDDELQHCCPHLAPDGSGLVYLARDAPKHRYPPRDVAGPLRWLRLDGGGARTLVAAARSYGWGNRAAIWHGPGALAYVDGDGRSALLDLASGRSTLLTTEPRRELGFLVDRTRRWASSGAPTFSEYDARLRRVHERPVLNGCEPYFTDDGRFGFWVSGNGGPLLRIDLATRRMRPIVRQNDPRIGPQRYLYFSMISRDGRWLAYGASDGAHQHFRSDYDVYVVPLDPRTLELAGAPTRVTAHPGTDRYPDVWVPAAAQAIRSPVR